MVSLLRKKIFKFKFRSSKAHGCYNISIKLINICSESLYVPLRIIFEQSLEEGKFSEIWKKVNVVPIHGKKIISFKKLLSN